MILKAFTFLDTKTGHFHTPFFFHHTGQAIRAVMDLGTDLQTTIGRHPNDYVLCEVGSWDDQAGTLIPAAPLQLGTVGSFLPPPQPMLPGHMPLPHNANGHAGA